MSLSEIRHKLQMQQVENKIKLIRMNWFIKNYEKLFQNPEKPKVLSSSKMGELFEEIQEMRESSKEIYKKLQVYQKDIDNQFKNKNNEQCIKEIAILPNMFPVPEDVMKELLNGVSKDAGRYKYLKIRGQLSPEEKYYFSPTNNYKYGWKIKNWTKMIGPKHRRKQVIKTTFYRSNGINLYEEHPIKRPPNPSGHFIYTSL
ncbi:uncharacterized protein LOC126905449 [Daktulosphaira vitifoliae]|uniref:uncharacterized protein LOC126905449 n=1 Tax=Daktulosphaira vitifoliae TaxID=58002 RepID=UPI0021AA13F4|nr:uncharacterized protein LOC126905449 [Daktulosphaira vitifoliae]